MSPCDYHNKTEGDGVGAEKRGRICEYNRLRSGSAHIPRCKAVTEFSCLAFRSVMSRTRNQHCQYVLSCVCSKFWNETRRMFIKPFQMSVSTLARLESRSYALSLRESRDGASTACPDIQLSNYKCFILLFAALVPAGEKQHMGPPGIT